MARHHFFCIEASSCWQAKLGGTQMELRREGLPRRGWTEEDRLHISLQDAEHVDEADIAEIVLAMDRAASACVPFVLYASTLVVFSQRDSRYLVCAGVTGELEKLKDLRSTLNRELCRLGYPRVSREFTPHITLARIQHDLGQPVDSRIHHLVGRHLEIEEPLMVNRFSLLQIIPCSGSIRYERIATANMAIH